MKKLLLFINENTALVYDMSIVNATPKHEKNFCDHCGLCLCCTEKCKSDEFNEHVWIEYVFSENLERD